MSKTLGMVGGVAVGVFVAPKVLEMTGATTNGVKLTLTIATIALAAWGGMMVGKAIDG